MNMLEKIQSRLEHLSKSERKVAEVILATPAQAIHSSIAALALDAGVSEPTVNRFCRSLETRGFPDFQRSTGQWTFSLRPRKSPSSAWAHRQPSPTMR